MTRPHPAAIRTEQAAALCRVGRLFGERRWCLATSGNFSLRADASHCLITQSGKDKSALEPGDLMLCDLDGNAVDGALRPSAETALHTALYRQDASIGAVLHTHSVTSTVLSRALTADLVLRGFEMQKAIRGVHSHEAPVTLPLFENTQDMQALAAAVIGRLGAGMLTVPGLLVRGHGLYAWGADLAEAQRHIEGFEFLLACAWQERQGSP
jgi:methylthioribulose-1-phosphate dehydratase